MQKINKGLFFEHSNRFTSNGLPISSISPTQPFDSASHCGVLSTSSTYFWSLSVSSVLQFAANKAICPSCGNLVNVSTIESCACGNKYCGLMDNDCHPCCVLPPITNEDDLEDLPPSLAAVLSPSKSLSPVLLE